MGATNLTVLRSMIGDYYETLEATPLGWVEATTNLIPSDQATETLRWLGMAPALRQWKGERGATTPKDYSTTITQYPYEASLSFLRRELAWDKTNQVRLRIQELAVRTQQHWADKLTELVVAAEGATLGECFDGQHFFDTDHVSGSSGTQSNDYSESDLGVAVSAGEAPTVPQMRDMILAVIRNMLAYKDDQGKPINENAKSFAVLCPVGLYPIVAKAVLTDVILDTGAIDNILRKIPGWSIDIWPNPRLDATSTWYSDGFSKFVVFRTDSRVKPFIRLEEPGGPRVTALDLDSEYYKVHNKTLFGVDVERGLGFGMWHGAALVTMVD